MTAPSTSLRVPARLRHCTFALVTALVVAVSTGPADAAPPDASQPTSDQLEWLGLVDSKPVTRQYIRSGAHPEHVGFKASLVITARWHQDRLRERAHDVSRGEPKPIWARTTEVRPDGLYRAAYVFDGGEDFTASPPQPYLPWPLVKGARREYGVHYANGESAVGWIEIVRVGIARKEGLFESDDCVEMKARDTHRKTDGSTTTSTSTVTWCKRYGVVRNRWVYQGWTVTDSLEALERRIEPGWEVAAPTCKDGRCGQAKVPPPTR